MKRDDSNLYAPLRSQDDDAGMPSDMESVAWAVLTGVLALALAGPFIYFLYDNWPIVSDAFRAAFSTH